MITFRKIILFTITIVAVFALTKPSYAASYVSGRFGNAISFDGTGDYIDMGDVSSSIKTVDFWVSPNSTTEKILELNGSSYIDVTSGTILATGFTSPTIYIDGVVSSTLSTGWHHIAVTTGTAVNANSVIVGKIGTTYFTGLIDSVRMYNRVLSASEISAHYSLGRGAHDNYTAKIKLVADDSNSYLDESLTNGQDYLLSYWYHLPSGNINPINFTISGSGTVTSEHSLTSDSDWLKHELSFEADQDGAHLFKFIQDGGTAGDSIVYVDNFDLQLNLVDKGGMEGTYSSGVAPGWAETGSTATPSESADEHTGAKAQAVLAGDTTNNVAQTVSVTSGNWYSFNAYAKVDSGSAYAELSGATTKTLTVSSISYQVSSYPFKAESDSLVIELYADATKTGIFDDISLVELDSVDPTVGAVSEVDSYSTGKWNDSNGSFLIDGSDVLSYSASGVLDTASGTISLWWKPVYDYDGFAEDAYLFDSEDASNKFMRLFYDYDDYKYIAHFYDGASWTNITASSTVQSFSAGAWQHIGVIYGNDSGIVRILVNGVEDETDSYTGAGWTAQTTPTYFYPGSLYGASINTNQASGYFDDIRIYSDALATSSVNAIYAINPNAPTNATWKRNLVTPIIDD